MEIFVNLFDPNNPEVFWAAISGTVALVVAISSFAKWIISKPNKTKQQKNRVQEVPILFPYGLLAFICLLVFSGIVVGTLNNWDGTFWLGVIAIIATTSTFWIQIVYIFIQKKNNREENANRKKRKK